MKVQLSTALSVLLATAVVAVPSKERQETRKQKIQQLLKEYKSEAQVKPWAGTKKNTTAHPADVIYDGNWGGISVPNNGITQVSATFTVPTVSLPSNDAASGTYYGCAWVGIDGDDSCSQGLWQAGAYWLYSNNAWNYFPFFEWYPGPVMQANMAISPGDSITVTIVATSTTDGTYYFTNNANGQTASGSLSGQPTLCEGTAEWIVENNNDSGVEMPDFGSVSFTDASYIANGATLGVSGGNVYVVDDNNVQYTNCAASGSSTVNCSWQS